MSNPFQQGLSYICLMQDRHSDNRRYFNEQAVTTEKFVLPYLSHEMEIRPSTRVLEIGCSMGGNMKPFLDLGCQVTGVEINPTTYKLAEEYFSDHPQRAKLTLILDDIYNRTETDGKFDIIIMRDVIEHIHDQEKFMGFVKRFMAPNAIFFLAFPPWYNPFGGHQQICKSKVLSKLPYFHILPAWLYKSVLKVFGESDKSIEDLLEIKETGISLERFERIARHEGYSIARKTHYFINPNYETKFGLKPRVQSGFVSAIPFVRNFFVTAGYYSLRLK